MPAPTAVVATCVPSAAAAAAHAVALVRVRAASMGRAGLDHQLAEDGAQIVKVDVALGEKGEKVVHALEELGELRGPQHTVSAAPSSSAYWLTVTGRAARAAAANVGGVTNHAARHAARHAPRHTTGNAASHTVGHATLHATARATGGAWCYTVVASTRSVSSSGAALSIMPCRRRR